MNLKKAYKKLGKVYDKKLDELNKTNKNQLNTSLEYFTLSLQYLRDYFILTEDLQVDGEENMKIVTIATAVSEYEKYKNCIHKYYNVTKAGATPKGSLTSDEALKNYSKERQFHWSTFWELVKENLDFWGVTDVTI